MKNTHYFGKFHALNKRAQMSHLQNINNSKKTSHSAQEIASTNPFADHVQQGTKRRQKLFRVYSENEKTNFAQETGHRLYDDDKYRPLHDKEHIFQKRHFSVNEEDRPNMDFNVSKDNNTISNYHPSYNDSNYKLKSFRHQGSLFDSDGDDDEEEDDTSGEQCRNGRGANLEDNEEAYNKFFTDSIELDNECVIPLDKLPRLKSDQSLKRKPGIAGKKRMRRNSDDMFDEYIPDFDMINNLNRLAQYYELNGSHAGSQPQLSQEIEEAKENDEQEQQDILSKTNITRHNRTDALKVGLSKQIGKRKDNTNYGNKEESQIRQSPRVAALTNASSFSSLKSILEHSKATPIPVQFSDRARKRLPKTGTDSLESTYVMRTGKSHDFELDLSKVPDNFDSLPYSQRKKTILTLFPNQDFKTVLEEIRSPKNKLRRRANTLTSNTSSSLSTKSLTYSSSANAQTLLQQFNAPNVDGLGTAGSSSSSLAECDRNIDQSTKKKSISKGLELMGYQLDKIIGYGAWGVIRECHSLTDKSDIKAMKIVRFKHHAEVRKSVLNEVNIWKQLHHKNILSLVTYHYDDHAMFCLMDKIQGGTLYDIVAKNWHLNENLDLWTRSKEVVQFALQIIDALRYLHTEKRIVHGDLKLENCLINEIDNRILLCDFGMAQSCPENTGSLSTQAREIIGFENSTQLSSANSSAPSSSSSSSSSLLSLSASRGASQIAHHKIRKLKDSSQDTPRCYGFKPSSSTLKVPVLHNDHSKSHSLMGITSFHSNYGPALQSLTLSSETILPSNLASRNSNSSLTQLQNLRESIKSPIMPEQHHHKQKHKRPEYSRIDDIENNDSSENQIGSLPYAAPELVANVSNLISFETDIWALGCMLYCMVLGRLPFQHEYEPRLRLMIESGKYNKALLKEALGPVDKYLYQAIEGCLIKDLQDRWNLEKVAKYLNKSAQKRVSAVNPS